ncbi:MAG: hypothetical protein B7Y25_06965 [Alphaproteobacteria bacterium 16-39-46]|nr:MAG: hypothetical protein B7Y25_06965 [Alphaproteobacteria bacterium 16-39-46]OZA41980.1 MAG: hypothetical protein B7X84_07080 [Alphaproteobacteria bacterium 17-39-52]HQS84633.1 hypothetical protein [Alphaproteobacteria bacterium]HQS94445.1 hypothetical protein [Alphaproteobacteria bacterium]
MDYNITFKNVLKIISFGIISSISNITDVAFSMDDREVGHSSGHVLNSQVQKDAEFSDIGLIGLNQEGFVRLPIKTWTADGMQFPGFKDTICHQANLAFVHQAQQTDYGKLRKLRTNFTIIKKLGNNESLLNTLEQEIEGLAGRVDKTLAYRTFIRNMIPGVIELVKTKNKGPEIDLKIEATVTRFFHSVREVGPFENLVPERDVMPKAIWKE